MAADFVVCNLNGIDIATILKSVFGTITAETPLKGIRIISVTADKRTPVLDCGSKDTALQLFKRCIGIADDDSPAIRVVIETYENGVGIESPHACGAYFTIEDLLQMSFVYDTDGNVALRIISIT